MKVFYYDPCASCEAKSLRQKDKSIPLCPQYKINEENMSIHPLKLKWKVLELLIPFAELIYWFLN